MHAWVLVLMAVGLAGTAKQPQCCGDCNGDLTVGVNEIVTAVGYALDGCPAHGSCCGDCDGSKDVAIHELLTSVGNALDGCPGSSTPPTATSPTKTLVPTKTPIPTKTAVPTQTTFMPTPVPSKTPTSTRIPKGTATPTPGLPRLSNAKGSISANQALIVQCQSNGFTDAFTVTASFTGDVVGGRLLVSATRVPSAGTADFSANIPSLEVGVAGNTLEFRACVTPNHDTGLRVQLQAVSPNGVTGNKVSVSFSL